MEKCKVIFIKNNKKNMYLHCEIADSIRKKMKGLMNRKILEENSGMIFPFAFPFIRFFWMKNVKVPLDIIFINRKKRIIAIYEAPVEKGFFYKQYFSRGFCKFVIECNIGFCKKNDIKVGDIIKFF